MLNAVATFCSFVLMLGVEFKIGLTPNFFSIRERDACSSAFDTLAAERGALKSLGLGLAGFEVEGV